MIQSLPFPVETILTQPIIDAISGAVNSLLITTVLCSFLVPIAIALLLSNSRNWKTPVFVMNICAISLGLAYGITVIYFQVRTIAYEFGGKVNYSSDNIEASDLIEADWRKVPPGYSMHRFLRSNLHPVYSPSPGNRCIPSP